MRRKKQVNPRPVMLSKRANVFYLEHVRVMQMDNRIVYATQDDGEIESFFNLPERNTAFVLLGKGSSITDAAMRRMAEANVMVGFCGSGGSPLFGALDMAFMPPQSEYRPTEYMQSWMVKWLDDNERIDIGKKLLKERANYAEIQWRKNSELKKNGIVIPEVLRKSFFEDVDSAESTQHLLLAEARWAKALYAILAKSFNFTFSREEGKGAGATRGDVCNGFLDHGNYIAYGYASVALCGLGISFSLPVLHGKTRRGALVFDFADVVKDALVMPTAFVCAAGKKSHKDFREELIEHCQQQEVLDHLFRFIIGLCENSE
ncbi:MULTISPECIES: type I-F CRISPR-associated endonuclease Cas1f [unclassified Desulfovibrio]|uniref:type I-F CRISPR-associated endonuclease Cas1f n=1 Tax=unclassified Desulfovibrio TaxID=2593640 RepID=UPI000F5F7BBC|nr:MULTISPECIES: type I-F CRISPR-associated endonuclease Cas1f [unclassified Desulfovibrio]RRD69260.1 type I-F CRISPR-associated endonuclease Cas1 [Desulfovibrio sp. OH1209_COT-279]RRD85723.1 type I-F CRISPR-associated endonuclease Cas1 [Desulfovibrio sp. OH1186_COT-070]